MTEKSYWQRVKGFKNYTESDYTYKGMQQHASTRLNQAVKNGTIIKVDDACQVCGRKCKTVAHHWNGYDNPFDVWWVCRICNRNLSNKNLIKDIKEAKKYIVQKLFSDRFDHYNREDDDTHNCAVCGLVDYGGNMMPFYNDKEIYWDYVFLCRNCSSDITGEK